MTEATGKLGVMIVGLGAVSTTFIAGVLSARKGLTKPVGALTQYDKIRVGTGEPERRLSYQEILSLPTLHDLEFAAWDVYPENAFESAVNADVLRAKDLLPLQTELEAIRPLPAAFDRHYAQRIDGTNVLPEMTRWEMVEHLRQDIRQFKTERGVERVVVLWAASTEIYVPVHQVHESVASLEAAMRANDCEHVAPSMCYAFAALMEGAPFIMGAPNTTVDIPAMWQLAEQQCVPIAGKDFKTGQTLVKSGFSPILSTRCLGLNGWFSTNILGNRDGEVLDDPDNFKTKEVSKLSVIESILDADEQPDLYKDIYHKVRINYYPPRKDNKEAWDNIDLFGWMGYPMEIKVNFLCRDSILAAPIALDLVLFSDLAARAGMSGIQTWLSFFCKSPMHDFDHVPEHDLFTQWRIVKQTLRTLVGEREPDYLS